jgi:hypothetical protein
MHRIARGMAEGQHVQHPKIVAARALGDVERLVVDAIENRELDVRLRPDRVYDNYGLRGSITTPFRRLLDSAFGERCDENAQRNSRHWLLQTMGRAGRP